MRHAKRRKRKSAARSICIMCMVCLVLVGVYSIGRHIESSTHKPQERGDLNMIKEDVPTVEHNDVQYQLRKGITSILVLGVDHPEGTVATGFRNGGQADFLMLMIIDDLNKRIVPLQIDRDTMAEITVLGVLGNVTGTQNAQICLSHGFGDGGKQSSQFTADAVSKLLLGTKIDFFVSMYLDGISVLNDAVGGVTVTLEDDFSSLDPTMTPGTTLTLMGKQAEYYVRNRMNIGIGTNEARQERQRVYMEALAEKIDEKMQAGTEAINTIYDTIEPYLETNMNRGRIINEIWNSRDYQRADLIRLKGEYQLGPDGFMEFHADPVALEQMVLELFYEPVEN